MDSKTILPVRSTTPAIDIYIKLSSYPILRDDIRERMREILFKSGIIAEVEFKREVKEKAIESQRLEGVHNPYHEESDETWALRKERVAAYLTDVYFGNNLGITRFEQVVEDVLTSQPDHGDNIELNFNPEVAPWKMLLRQGKIYENLPPQEQEAVAHHLEEIKVVMIKRVISEHLRFVAVAKKVFQVDDIHRIYRRRIGGGKIGGKAAGMALAWKILQEQGGDYGPDISRMVDIPDSFFIGTEVVYEFRLKNKLERFMNQKYRPMEEIREEYPRIMEAHLKGRFPTVIVNRLREVLEKMGNDPVIVRSSSLLEDNFGFSFAGKYDSYFCPNQGTPEENLQALLDAIRRVYAGTVNPDAILYRRQNNLIDFDERMAILLQRVRGERYGRYYFPALAGVAFSENSLRWNPKIRREDGFMRLVWGLGTRAVDRVSNDYPRMVALSHPKLRPESDAKAKRHYAQWYVDAIDLEDNAFVTKPSTEVLGIDYPHIRLIASLDKGDYLPAIRSVGSLKPSDKFVLTFETLLKDEKFIKLMRTALRRIQLTYGVPVDMEFTVEIIDNYPTVDYRLHILQCRPLSMRGDYGSVTIPDNIAPEDLLFTTGGLISNGKVEGVQYIIFVDPQKYATIASPAARLELGRAIGRLNDKLADKSFVLMGPGRWGSSNIELGVRVTYADIYNTKALVEIAVEQDGHSPELSYGTHFFQDLVESGIYSLPLHVNDKNGVMNWSFFRHSPNSLQKLSTVDAELAEYLRVIDLDELYGNRRLTLAMNGEQEKAAGFLVEGNWKKALDEQGRLSVF